MNAPPEPPANERFCKFLSCSEYPIFSNNGILEVPGSSSASRHHGFMPAKILGLVCDATDSEVCV